MKTLIIIFGLLYAVHCKPADLDPNDYLNDEQNEGDNYDDGEDEDNVAANEEQEIAVVSKGETFVRDLGDSVLLPCVFSSNNDYVRLWRKNNIILYQSLIKMGASENSHELPNGTLQITNITAEDAGQYECSTLIYPEPKKNPTVTHTLKLKTAPRIVSLTTKDNRTVLQSGSTLSLHCQATGVPTPVITWHKDGNRFPSEGEIYSVLKVKHHDAGQYSCMADNHVGNPDVKVINIKVEYKPTVFIDQITVNSITSEDTDLVCTVHAEPKADVVWKKDGVNIKNSDRHVLSSNNKNHFLTIKNLQEPDFGVYTCSATNYLGTTDKNVTLAKTPAILGLREPKSENRELVLVWEVKSKSPITANELQYRKKGESEWHTVNPEPTTKDNEFYIVKYSLKGLDPGDYETRIKSFNAHGWSEYSEIKTFRRVHAKTGHNKAHKKPHRDGKDKQVTTPEPTQNTGEPAEHQVVTTKDPKVGANESSGCSSLTSTVTLLNVALVVIFLVRPPTIRI